MNSRHIVRALIAAGLLGACSETTVPGSESPVTEVRTPSQLVPEGNTEFVAIVGTTIEPGPAVRVLDEKNNPVAGVPVSFGSVPSRVVVSGPDGIARFGPWALDTVAREYFIGASVRISATRELVTVFHARATPGPAARVTAVGGNNQVGRPSRSLPSQLHVKLTDLFGNAVSGALVSFSVMSGGGTLELTSSVTDFNGVATAGRWKLGTDGPQQVIGKAGDLEALFEATFCGPAQPCDPVPENLAYTRGGAVWINGADGPFIVANNASRPSWSPDGSRLAFFKVNANREEEAICIAPEPFSNPACTPVDVFSRYVAGDMRVSWSPDGGMLALSRVYYGEGQLQLLFLDVATMKIHRHGTVDGSVWSASWSPDGKRMAIATDSKVYLANAAGSGLEVLLPYTVWELAWSPDGQKIAVMTATCPWDCYGADIALLDPATKALTVFERSQGSFNGLTWSPDGRFLEYSAWSSSAGMRNVRIMSVASGTVDVGLTNASDPSWRP